MSYLLCCQIYELLPKQLDYNHHTSADGCELPVKNTWYQACDHSVYQYTRSSTIVIMYELFVQNLYVFTTAFICCWWKRKRSDQHINIIYIPLMNIQDFPRNVCFGSVDYIKPCTASMLPELCST